MSVPGDEGKRRRCRVRLEAWERTRSDTHNRCTRPRGERGQRRFKKRCVAYSCRAPLVKHVLSGQLPQGGTRTGGQLILVCSGDGAPSLFQVEVGSSEEIQLVGLKRSLVRLLCRNPSERPGVPHLFLLQDLSAYQGGRGCIDRG